MQFVYPYFLFALCALAIPIVVHLFNFRRYKKVFFSNTSFLKELVEESNNAQKLKRLLILLSRCLAIIFLVLAFAQPFFPAAESIKKGRTVVSVFVDNSFSMNANNAERTLLEKAKILAIEIAESYPNDVSFQLITQDLSGKQQRLLSKDDFITQVKSIRIASSSYTLEEIKKRQVDAMRVENFDLRKAYYISDFQSKLGWISPDSMLDINMVHLESVSNKNIYVDSAWLENPMTIIGQNNKLLVRVKNDGEDDLANLRVSMTLNGQQKALADMSIDANSETIDTIHFNQNVRGWNNVCISLEDNPIVFDNKYFVSFYVNESIALLNIDSKASNKYIAALGNFSNFFKITETNANQIDYSQFKQQQLIILSNIADISSGMQAELKKYVEQGGHIALFPSKDANISSLNTFLQALNLPTYTSANDQNKEVANINTQSSLLNDMFETNNQMNMSLPKSSFSYSCSSRLSNAETILSFKDGQSFMTQYNILKGRAYIFTVPLDASICDFPMHSLFAPMIFKMAIDGNIFNAIQYTIGSKQNITIPSNIALGNENIVLVKGPGTEFIPEQNFSNLQPSINVRDQIVQDGHYALIDNRTKENIASFSMNYNRSESAMKFYSRKDLEAKYAHVFDGNKAAIGHAVKELNDDTSLWKVCIIFALLFLLVEILLVRFWKNS